jgi:hypothetical protein
LLALAGTMHSDHTDVSGNKYKHLAEPLQRLFVEETKLLAHRVRVTIPENHKLKARESRAHWAGTAYAARPPGQRLRTRSNCSKTQ